MEEDNPRFRRRRLLVVSSFEAIFHVTTLTPEDADSLRSSTQNSKDALNILLQGLGLGIQVLKVKTELANALVTTSASEPTSTPVTLSNLAGSLHSFLYVCVVVALALCVVLEFW